ncbi:MAG TPA: 3-phosphoshikimate 1-carboxyvinyltransferase [Verrucomicrobiae bacterium]|jgi:3-phosphoshikimate 1-carboxyvinyltransferase
MLPDLIEIVPLDKPVHAEITVPGSKSITNRALVLAALADGEVTLQGALWSEDTQVMVDCLQRLGFEVRVERDPNEFCNRTIMVRGRGGEIPNAGTVEKPLELFVGNAGTAARFLSALVCLGRGVYRLSGVPRMHERPQAALFGALRELGYQVESSNKLPAVIHGTGPLAGKCRVSIEESSQFASALLLCTERSGWQIEVVDENAEESPYVEMTKQLVGVFPKDSRKFIIEPDSSSGSYIWAASWLFTDSTMQPQPSGLGHLFRVKDWPLSDWQIDTEFPKFLRTQSNVSRTHDLGDSIMTAIVIASFGPKPIRFTDLGRLRVQECERVVALRTELTKCGAKVIEIGDTLEVYPSQLHGAEIETYNDHRMAMCFAVLGLKVPGIKLRNPSCVKKTFPNFFQKLAAAPPHGLGVTILDARSGRKLSHDELFAD